MLVSSVHEFVIVVVAGFSVLFGLFSEPSDVIIYPYAMLFRFQTQQNR